MSHNLVVVGGRAPSSFNPSCNYDKIICADSGYDTALKYGLKPTVVVGDFDSTEFASELEKKGYRACSHDKDETDAELALMKLFPGDTYDLIGGGEGRLDHVMALLSLFYRYAPPKHWYTKVEELILVDRELSFNTEPGAAISIIPVRPSEKVWVSSEGLVWELRNYEISAGSISLSNRAKQQKITIAATGQVFCCLIGKED
jgi:thiamine pyrophosphokinase